LVRLGVNRWVKGGDLLLKVADLFARASQNTRRERQIGFPVTYSLVLGVQSLVVHG
jgi:hypothetical protein